MHSKPSYLLPGLAFILVWALAACTSTQTPPQREKIPVEVTRIVQVTTEPQVVEVTREVKVKKTVEIVVTATPGQAGGCFATALTQGDMNNCAAANYEQAKKELEAVMSAFSALHIPENDKKELEDLQREWQTKMERDCDYLYGRINKDENGNLHYQKGSMAPMLVAGCKANATRYRSKELDFAYFPVGR